MLLNPNNTRFPNSEDLITNIIIVPLHEILDNIYQLLSHAPTCQSSLRFTPLQSHASCQSNLNKPFVTIGLKCVEF